MDSGIETQGGSLLSYARNILQTNKPLHPDTHPPPLLLAALQGSARFIPAADHKTLFDKISALFVRQFKVYIPYRVPLKIPLLTAPLKKSLHGAICTAIEEDTSWPPSLRTYVKSRVQLISQRTSTVRTVLTTAQLSDLPTSILHRTAPETCPCHRWAHLPGVGNLRGNAFFRDPEVLSRVLPPNSKCDWSVFNQNMKNATVPAYKSFKETLLSSVQQLSGSLPDIRNRVTCGIAKRIADLCEHNYKCFGATFPRHVYAPYLAKQARRMPPGITVGVFNKGPTVANFAYPLAWQQVFKNIFHASPRFAELATFNHPLDAKCWLFWQLCDSISLALTGNYCGCSVFRPCTPLSNTESGRAYKAFTTYPPSPAAKRLLQPMLDTGCRKLKSAGPTSCMLEAPSAPPTFPLLHTTSLRSVSASVPFFDEETPTQQPPQLHTDSAPVRHARGRTNTAQPDCTRRRAQLASRVRSSRRWRTIFTDHDLLEDSVRRGISSAVGQAANAPMNHTGHCTTPMYPS